MEPTTQFKQCPQCRQPSPLQAGVCAACGRQFRTQFPPDDRTQFFGAPPPHASAPPPFVPPTYPPQPQYVQPQHTATDTCAILSVVFGGMSLALFCLGGWFFATASITLGIVSLFRLRSNPNLTGQPMAITGIALSAPAFLWGIYVLYVWMLTVAQSSTPRTY